MGENVPEEMSSESERPSPFDRALTLTARQTELLSVARALIAEHRELRASLSKKLRADVAAYTRVLRDEGVPPERALALVKAAVMPALNGPVDERRELMESVVHWCVDAYYAA